MSWEVTLEIVDCASASTKLVGASIYSPIIDNAFHTVYTDANGQAILYDPYDTWEWVTLTISKSGTGGDPSDPGYDPGYINKNFVINRSMNGTIQTVCLNKAPIPDPGGSTTTPSCFIVTATTGSAESVELKDLRRLRERVCSVSAIGTEIIEAVYQEYELFSPAIATELERDAIGRQVALDVVVRPLITWYQLAEALALDHVDPKASSDTARERFSVLGQYADETVIVAVLKGIRAGTRSAVDVPPLLRELVSRLAEWPFVSWAILDPLIRVWQSVRDDCDLSDDVAEWLVAAPFELVAPSIESEVLDREVKALVGFVAFKPGAPAMLRKRLLAAWPGAAGALDHARVLEPALSGKRD